MRKALVLFAHPFAQKSRVNRTIMETLKGFDNVHVHDLYEEYPYFHINVAREQALLQEHDLVVWQHPFYWFSMPPLMKLWCDEVLRKGFAFGPGGDKLKDKDFLVSITTGGLGDPDSLHEIEDAFFSPYQKTAEICGMNWLPPLILTQSTTASEMAVRRHAESVRHFLLDYCVHEENALLGSSDKGTK